MDDLKLRQAVAGDSEFAYGLKKAAFREYVEKVWGWDEEEQRRLHRERFAAHDFRIISASGTDVGIMVLALQHDCLKLNQLFILPEYQNKGIGCKCMSLVIKEGNRLRLPVRLGVLKVNPRALAFYERLGFVCAGETETHTLMRRDVPQGNPVGCETGQVDLK